MVADKEIIFQIKASLEVLKRVEMLLLELIKSYPHERRIKISMSDVSRTQEHADYYLSNDQSIDINNFRYHSNLVNLRDSLCQNDFGIILTNDQIERRGVLCNELLIQADILINLLNSNQSSN